MRYAGIVVALALVALVAVPDGGARASGDGTASVDAAFKQAFLAGDLDAFFELLAPDVYAIEPFGSFTSRAALREGFLAFAAANPGLSVGFSESAVMLNTAVHRAFATSEPIRRAGVGRIVVIHTLVVAGGKVVTFTALPDLSDPETARFVRAAGG
jgi:hypothetical protein